MPMNLGLRRSIVAMGIALALGACSGAPTSVPTEDPFAEETDEPVDIQTDEPNVGPTEGPQSTDATYDFGDGRPTTVTVTITGSTGGGYADGTFTDAALARNCGPTFVFPNGFTYGFPQDGQHNPEDVTFGAEELLSGTSTTKFNISAVIIRGDGGKPPGVSISPGENEGDVGTAKRDEANGTTTLTIDATSRFGEHMTVIATCGPRP